jgi:plastocyanin
MLAAVVALLVAPACSSSSRGTTAASTVPTTTRASTSGGGTQLGNGTFTIGTRVAITDNGYDPQVLVAAMGSKITWTNRSASVQSVHFDNYGAPVDSGAIRPGHTWTFHAVSTGSILYHSTYDDAFRGQLQVQLGGVGQPGG